MAREEKSGLKSSSGSLQAINGWYWHIFFIIYSSALSLCFHLLQSYSHLASNSPNSLLSSPFFFLFSPAVIVSYLSFLSSFCLSLLLRTHTLCFFHLCSRQQIKKSWSPLNTHHLHAAVCVVMFIHTVCFITLLYVCVRPRMCLCMCACVCVLQRDDGVAIGGWFIRRSDTHTHIHTLSGCRERWMAVWGSLLLW